MTCAVSIDPPGLADVGYVKKIGNSLPLCRVPSFDGPGKISGGLQVHPQLWCGVECLGEIQGRVGSDTAFVFDQLIQACAGPTQVFGKSALGHVHGGQEFFQQNPAGVEEVCG